MSIGYPFMRVLKGKRKITGESDSVKPVCQRGMSMVDAYTAVIKEDGDWWIGWIEEVPGVNCQEDSREALLDTLRITLKEVLVLRIASEK